MWAISASICPIGSLLLLAFAPKAPATHPEWFAFFVGAVGIAFGLCTALMISWLVAKPLDELRIAAQAVARGEFDRHIATARADEFGLLIGEFNRMLRDLKDKEKLRQTFGLHVGKRAAEQILARDPGLSGAEQEITVMFVDIRSSTARAAAARPAETVEILNDFFRVTVRVVEEEHSGMVNKYLGDGFMAVFGADDLASNHAQNAFDAGRQILLAVDELNLNLISRGRAPLAIGVGIHSGPAIVGSIGSPQRLEFTAIGDTVNVASRIESLTKVVGKRLLITKAVRDRLEDVGGVEELPPQPVRGVAEPISVFAPKDEA
jgi:adenylate cyclase